MEDDSITCEEQNTQETLVPDNVQNTMKRIPGKRKLQIQEKMPRSAHKLDPETLDLVVQIYSTQKYPKLSPCTT